LGDNVASEQTVPATALGGANSNCALVSQQQTHEPLPANAHQKHIMLSYSWKYQPLVLELRDHLRAKGYEVWVYVEQMAGSKLEAMASAVENAHALHTLIQPIVVWKGSTRQSVGSRWADSCAAGVCAARLVGLYHRQQDVVLSSAASGCSSCISITCAGHHRAWPSCVCSFTWHTVIAACGGCHRIRN
jgi:hypothetical protein